jgi:hypothetical protein
MLVTMFISFSVFLAVLFFIGLILVRNQNREFTNTIRDHHLEQTLLSVFSDSSFSLICKHYCMLSEAEADELIRLFEDESQFRIANDYVFSGGWVGQVPGETYYGVALSRHWPTYILWSVAIHEMFHLVRHVQGHAPFEAEANLRFYHLRRFRLMLNEEIIVWRKTLRVDQIGALCVFLPFIAFASSYIVATLLIIQRIHNGEL